MPRGTGIPTQNNGGMPVGMCQERVWRVPERANAWQARATSDQGEEQASVTSPDMAGPFLAKNGKGPRRRQGGLRPGQLPLWCKTAEMPAGALPGAKKSFPPLGFLIM